MPAQGDDGHSVLALRVTAGSADPSALRDYAVIVNGAWTLLGFACFCAMVPLSFLVQLTIGNSALA